MAVQNAYQVDIHDNVATALTDLEPGAVCLLGNRTQPEITAVEPITAGHKIALQDIAPGEKIIKYNVVIGEATRPVSKGCWVHLHCMKSLYDERSSHLDVHTGAPKDIVYE